MTTDSPLPSDHPPAVPAPRPRVLTALEREMINSHPEGPRGGLRQLHLSDNAARQYRDGVAECQTVGELRAFLAQFPDETRVAQPFALPLIDGKKSAKPAVRIEAHRLLHHPRNRATHRYHLIGPQCPASDPLVGLVIGASLRPHSR